MASLKTLLVVGIFAAAATLDCYGWGCSGHEVVALVAQRQLSPAARAQFDALLKDAIDPARHRYCSSTSLGLMTDVSTWADDSRAADRATAPWHFIDIPLEATRIQVARSCDPEQGCVTSAIRDQLATLENRAASRDERARALMFLIHFVADLHQPLHAATNGDRGGNCVPVSFLGRSSRLAYPATESYRPNLHAVWDTEVPETIGAIARSSHDADVERFVEELMERYRGRIPRWSAEKLDLDAWAWESHEVAVQYAYARLPRRIPVAPAADVSTCAVGDVGDRMKKLDERIGAAYLDAVDPAVRLELVKAGTRLAAILNRLWPASPDARIGGARR